MKCKVAHVRIVEAAYEELFGEEKLELERHLLVCSQCACESKQVQELRLLAQELPVLEPDANLIARSRMRLGDALDALPPPRWHKRLSRLLGGGALRLLSEPVAVCLLLLAGSAAGGLGGYQFARSRAAQTAAASASIQPSQSKSSRVLAAQTQASIAQQQSKPAPPVVANVSSIEEQPNSRLVEVRYDQLVPQRTQGSLDDPEIQRLLMRASRSAVSVGVRDRSVALLAAECRAGHSCQQAGIRDALLAVLRNDKSAGVREKALLGLEPYVAEDLQVRDAVLDALLNDANSRIRTKAINIIGPVEADTSVRQVLYSVSNTDRNPYIRTVSRQVLSQVPEIQ